MVVDKTDIAIIGGGVQGIFLAYYAKLLHPNKRVSLYEAEVIGNGISAYSGHLHTHYGSGYKHSLAEISINLYKNLVSEYTNFPMEERDFIGVCHKEKLEAVLADLTQKNVLINKANYPFAEFSNNHVTISGIKAYATKRNLLPYLHELIASKGVKVFEGTRIKDIQKESEGYSLINQVNKKNLASVVLNASGKNLFEILKTKNRDVRTKKVVAFHIDKWQNLDSSIYYFFDDDAFLLPQPYFNRYLFSYRCEEWDINKNTEKFVITETDLNVAKGVLKKYTSDFSEHILGGQVYIDIYNTPNSLPIICEIDKNYFVIGATGGSGIRLAPALAIETIKQINL
ncbi:FAD-dependent oxidoreductase [Flavobacterium oreochromis]|uniref:FAD-dependent oxidoreductase n=1 Tax=Flavobacterium oreochromis TaxID=2906078 RepID=UPI000CDA1E87|nr:hypothetical protein BWK58_08830 [Flavobacterium columnare]